MTDDKPQTPRSREGKLRYAHEAAAIRRDRALGRMERLLAQAPAQLDVETWREYRRSACMQAKDVVHDLVGEQQAEGLPHAAVVAFTDPHGVTGTAGSLVGHPEHLAKVVGEVVGLVNRVLGEHGIPRRLRLRWETAESRPEKNPCRPNVLRSNDQKARHDGEDEKARAAGFTSRKAFQRALGGKKKEK